MQRRGLLLGLGGLLVSPAIVRAQSLMPVSSLIYRLPALRIVVRIRHGAGGMETIVGEAAMQDLDDLPKLAASMCMNGLGRLAIADGDSIAIHLLAEGESIHDQHAGRMLDIAPVRRWQMHAESIQGLSNLWPKLYG